VGGPMFPFRRHGDEVILERDADTVPFCLFAFQNFDTYPKVITQTCNWPIPGSASAAIANLQIEAPGGNNVAAVLEPVFPTMTQDPLRLGHFHYIAQVQVDSTNANGRFAIVDDAKIFMPGGVVTVGVPWGTTVDTVATLSFRGYVETVHHMY